MVSSLLRLLYYMADYWIGQALVWLRYTSRGVVVLYDRYFFDFVADPERSNLRLPSSWVRFLRASVVEPDVNVLLYADPDRIRARKSELESWEIRALTRRYRTLFSDLGRGSGSKRYHAIDNRDLEETVARVTNLVLEEL